MVKRLSRRDFLRTTVLTGGGLSAISTLSSMTGTPKPEIKFGLVTYQWGQDWDLPTLIANCEKTGIHGVELRTQHSHGVEKSLSAVQRAEVKKRFAASSVICIGYGSNFEFHNPDPKIVRENIEGAKEYIKLCKDIGASGIKVKPNGLAEQVPKEKTIAQIGASLNEIGRFAQDYGMLVRVEAHGTLTEEIPNMKAIFGQVREPNIKLCWNCNEPDLSPPGFDEKFKSVQKWIGDTVHIHELNINNYPYGKLFSHLAAMNYKGWVLLEASTQPADRIAALKEQVSLFEKMVGDLTNL